MNSDRFSGIAMGIAIVVLALVLFVFVGQITLNTRLLRVESFMSQVITQIKNQELAKQQVLKQQRAIQQKTPVANSTVQIPTEVWPAVEQKKK